MKKSLVICSSATFYKNVVNIADQLEAMGLLVIIPKTAQQMKQSGDFNVEKIKTWHNNPDDYAKKADYIRDHFDQITAGDAILVVNDEKHATPGYIGPNVLMEMALAWYQKKPVFLMNPLPEQSPFEEEIKGMSPTVINGNLSALLTRLNQS